MNNKSKGKTLMSSLKLIARAMAILMLCTVALQAAEPVSSPSPRAFYEWAATPPMGWNSWDAYGPTVTEAEVRANADYMAAHLKEYGWRYVVVDIRWYVTNPSAHGYNQTNPDYVLDEYGRLLPAVNRFPSAKDGRGFKPLADYIHSQGLKFGIHVMRGVPVAAVERETPILDSTATAADIYSKDMQCRWLRDMYTIVAGRPGAQEYYDSILRLYASWGVDYIKVDDLSHPYHASEIEMIRRAIDACGRPIVLSLSPGDTPIGDAEHVMTHANLWRISADFWDRWQDIEAQFALCSMWSSYMGPGHWPDADMLPLGRIGIRAERGDNRMTRLTHAEQITLMTLWAIFRSPLMFGGDLPSNDEFTLALLTNREVLSVNQHSTGNRQLFNRGGSIAWVASVPDSGDRYLALFNTNSAGPGGAAGEEISVPLDELGLTGSIGVQDLWQHETLGDCSGTFSARIPPHGAGLYRLTPR
jgi:alpha-galactosidase